MSLFLQLNLSELPEAVKGEYGEGLIQVFYCTNLETDCEAECGAFVPFSKSVNVRLVRDIGGKVPLLEPAADQLFPSLHIEDWEEYFEYPAAADLENLGINLDEEATEELDSSPPMYWDKLGGHPSWLQYPEYPECPQCSAKMRLVYQIRGEEHLPWAFGDEGCAYITQCETHREILALLWQCG